MVASSGDLLDAEDLGGILASPLGCFHDFSTCDRYLPGPFEPDHHSASGRLRGSQNFIIISRLSRFRTRPDFLFTYFTVQV